jgi:hypothetical protein
MTAWSLGVGIMGTDEDEAETNEDGQTIDRLTCINLPN